mgnify:CR=1 FL=1
MELGINLDKVIFAYENCDMVDANKDYGFVESVVGTEFASVIKHRYHAVRGVEAYGNLCFEKSTHGNLYTSNMSGGGTLKQIMSA